MSIKKIFWLAGPLMILGLSLAFSADNDKAAAGNQGQTQPTTSTQVKNMFVDEQVSEVCVSLLVFFRT